MIDSGCCTADALVALSMTANNSTPLSPTGAQFPSQHFQPFVSFPLMPAFSTHHLLTSFAMPMPSPSPKQLSPKIAPLSPSQTVVLPVFKKKRNREPRICKGCNRSETPQWRRGPDGRKSLCNACGLHFHRILQREKQVVDKPAPSSASLNFLLN